MILVNLPVIAVICRRDRRQNRHIVVKGSVCILRINSGNGDKISPDRLSAVSRRIVIQMEQALLCQLVQLFSQLLRNNMLNPVLQFLIEKSLSSVLLPRSFHQGIPSLVIRKVSDVSVISPGVVICNGGTYRLFCLGGRSCKR